MSAGHDRAEGNGRSDAGGSRPCRFIAFYLPQFHPIPENDEWWGKGFTEWTNVAKAKPLYPGHDQPRLPRDLGYYDLRVPETREAQADLAKRYGIEGFCYWHYWFAGRRILERPFQEVLKSGQPSFPFCLAWANQSWTGVWHGAEDRVLIAQTYNGLAEARAHFHALVDAFHDPRYLRVEGKPIFVVYRPQDLPDPRVFVNCWQELAIKSGLPGIYFLGTAGHTWNPRQIDFEGCVIAEPDYLIGTRPRSLLERITRRAGPESQSLYQRLARLPTIYSYRNITRDLYGRCAFPEPTFPSVVPNWDNTPRCGRRGVVFHGSTPALFRRHLREAAAYVASFSDEKRLVFIKSWNEWAEGNYLEPDQRFGTGYLEAIRDMPNTSMTPRACTSFG